MRLLFMMAAILLLAACTPDKQNSTTQVEVDASQLEILADGKLRLLKLNGTPYERGFQHGTLLKADIEGVLSGLKNDIQSWLDRYMQDSLYTGPQNPEAFIQKFLADTEYHTVMEQLQPDLLEELKGISDGSGIDYETIFFLQLGDEYWFNSRDLLAHSCSSFGANKTEDRGSLAAQNMDIPPFFHGYQTVVKAVDPASDVELLYLTIPGHLGITGMNNQSVSINCNTLMQLDYATTGIPVTGMVRGVIGRSTQEEALNFLKSVKHASGQNYIIGGPEKVFSMECSTNEVAEFRPFADAAFTYHTNHPMANTDYNQYYLDALEEAGKTPEEGIYQCQRIRSFEARFTGETQDIDVAAIKEVLRSRDHDGWDVVSNEHTYASVIYDLGIAPQMIIAPGKPHETEYLTISF